MSDFERYSRYNYGKHAQDVGRAAHSSDETEYDYDAPATFDGGKHAHNADEPVADHAFAGPAVNADASSYSRYSNDAQSIRKGAHDREVASGVSALHKKKKRSLAKRIGIVVGCVLLAMLVAGSAYALWFTSALDKALAPDEQTSDALASVLSPEASGKPYYILVMGSDSREGNGWDNIDQTSGNERSDVMMLLRVDAIGRKITILSIPRDTPYRLADGSYVKINEMFNDGGAAGAVKAVSELTGLPISHHAQIRVSGLENIVDMLGGVTVDVPVDMSYKTTDGKEVTIEAGRQTLNGKEAQIFSRARHEYEGNQDEHRQGSVRQLLTAIVKKILDRPVNEIPGVVLQIANYVETDYKSMDAIGLAMTFAGGDMTMYSGTGPSEGDINEQAGGKWLCYLNPGGWQKIVELTDAGEKPEGVDFEKTQILWTEVTDQPDFDHSYARCYYYGARLDENGNWTTEH